MAEITLLVGSKSDVPAAKSALETLDRFGVRHQAFVISAHRAPERLQRVVRQAEEEGTRVFIAGAGMAAALPGAVASLTRRPVIGLPLASGALNGIDALLAVAQMPPGVPVGTVAINGAANAAYLALEILALSDAGLDERLRQWRSEQAGKVDAFE
ncbi:MAG: 5-(carboxyamino)imidazole ribonucleotide mutase [Chloroflexota bacterium]|nr:5-(carboxyamino)imidazole ribonucleotide mutase [Chloroflexota bacterium]